MHARPIVSAISGSSADRPWLSQPSRFMVGVLLAVAVLLPQTTLAGDLLEFTTGGTTTVDTAWGKYSSYENAVWTCQPFEFPYADEAEGHLQSVELRVTSPGGRLQAGDVNALFFESGGGYPTNLLGQAAFDVTSTPTTYPIATPLLINTIGDTVTATVTTNTEYLFCVETDNPSVHVAGYRDYGSEVLSSYDGGTTLYPEMGFSLGFTLMLELEDATGTAACKEQIFAQGGWGRGANRSEFDTVIQHLNTAGAAYTVTAGIVPRGAETWRNLGDTRLEAGEMRTFRLSEMLDGVETFGMVLLRCSDDANKSSHNNAGGISQSIISATGQDGQQFGQVLTGADASLAQQAGDSVLLFTTHAPERYRVNVGVTAVEDNTVVQIQPMSSSGAALASTHQESFNSGGNTQINDIHSFFKLGNEPNVMISVNVVSGAAFTYASVLDGAQSGTGTSDPTTVIPVETGTSKVTLLELGRVIGFNEFSGSAMVHNHADKAVSITAKLYKRNTPGAFDKITFELDPHETKGWDDIVGELFGRTNLVGTVVLQGPSDAQISAIGREFSIFRDSQGNVTGTAGQLMPGLKQGDLLRPGSTYHFLGLRDRSGPSGEERSNLAMFNVNTSDVTITIKVFDAKGKTEGQPVKRVAHSGELIRIDRILNEANPNQDGETKRIEVQVTGPAHVLTYKVNTSGDPVTLTPFRTD